MSHTDRLAVLAALSPDERALPPSMRRWARLIQPNYGPECLELRDRNSGLGTDPAARPRHQYLVARGYLWTRSLPAAPLDQPDDETPWTDDATASRWHIVSITDPTNPLAIWARVEGVPLVHIIGRAPTVRSERQSRDPDGTGSHPCTIYRMPPADPVNVWADITGVPCPVDGCDQTLVWYEAGYVPGYRVCMAEAAAGTYRSQTARHRFALDHADHADRSTMSLIYRGRGFA